MEETPQQIVERLQKEFDEFILTLEKEHSITIDPKEDWICLWDFNYRKIFTSPKYGMWLYYNLTPTQKKHLNTKISPLQCWKNQRLCHADTDYQFTRPHFTCLACYLRKVVEGKAPKTIPILLHMVFIHQTPNTPTSRIGHLIARYLLTLAETLSSI